MKNEELDRAIGAACDEIANMVVNAGCECESCPLENMDGCLEEEWGEFPLRDRLEVWFRKKYGFEAMK